MLDLDALKAFVAACEEGSVSRAAQRLFRSQPAVTRQILALEKELGTVLLDRSSRGVRATPSGGAVFEKAQKLLRDVEALSGSAHDPGGDSGDLRIACSDTVAQYWLAPLLGGFAKSFPGARLHLSISSSPEIANRVASGLDDVGFVLLPLQHPSLLHRTVLGYRHVAAFAKGQTPKGSGEITAADLADRSLVLLGRQTRSRQLIEEGFLARGLWPQRVVEVGNVSVQKELVRVGLGVGVLPDYAARPDDGLEYRAIENASVREIALVTHRTNFPGGVAERFVKLVLGDG
jgi:LysR family transcriptional regulator, hydrogen peroxide-inducible genes activator